MSGTRGVGVEVISAEELERRALVAAEELWGRVQGDLSALARMVKLAKARGLPVVDVSAQRPAGGGAAAIRAAAEALRGTVAAVAEQLERQMTEHRASELMEAFTKDRRPRQHTAAAGKTGGAAPVGPAGGRSPAGPSQRVLESAARLVARAEATAAHLDGGLGEEWIALIDRIARAADDAEACVPLSALRGRVEAAETRAVAAGRLRAACRAALDQLAGCGGEETERLRAELAGDVSATRLPALQAEVNAAVSAWRAEEDRRFSLSTLSDVLTGLGYDVQPTLDTAAAPHPPSCGTYGLRSHPIAALVVRNGVRSDPAMEECWSDDLAQARQELACRGILSSLARNPAAGELSVTVQEPWLPDLREHPEQQLRRRAVP